MDKNIAYKTQTKVNETPGAGLPAGVSAAIWRPMGFQGDIRDSILRELNTNTPQSHPRQDNSSFQWSKIDSQSRFRLLIILPGRSRPTNSPALRITKLTDPVRAWTKNAQQLFFVTEGCEVLILWSSAMSAYKTWREQSLLSDIPDIISMQRSRWGLSTMPSTLNSSKASWNRKCVDRLDKEVSALIGGTTPFVRQRLFDVLEATRRDRKDKLFAVLPLFSNTLAIFALDYRESTFAVYRDLTWSFLQHNVPNILSLENLCHSHGNLS
ncbi:hypothetical protein LTR27_000551 [Elasticomyces elasticus]|nr:hypothetical protein LTR27_000551 [Elasticomyces elasticus]